MKKNNENRIITAIGLAFAIIFLVAFLMFMEMGYNITLQQETKKAYNHGFYDGNSSANEYAKQAFKDGKEMYTPDYITTLENYFDANRKNYVAGQFDCTNMSYELAQELNKTNIVEIVYGKMLVNGTWGGHAWIKLTLIIDPANMESCISKDMYEKKYQPIKSYTDFALFNKQVS